MKQITCKQIGVEGCDHTSVGRNDLETTKALHEHAKVAHADLLKNMTDEEAEAMNQKILGILEPQPAEPEPKPEKSQETPKQELSTPQKPTELSKG